MLIERDDEFNFVVSLKHLFVLGICIDKDLSKKYQHMPLFLGIKSCEFCLIRFVFGFDEAS